MQKSMCPNDSTHCNSYPDASALLLPSNVNLLSGWVAQPLLLYCTTSIKTACSAVTNSLSTFKQPWVKTLSLPAQLFLLNLTFLFQISTICPWKLALYGYPSNEEQPISTNWKQLSNNCNKLKGLTCLLIQSTCWWINLNVMIKPHMSSPFQQFFWC